MCLANFLQKGDSKVQITKEQKVVLFFSGSFNPLIDLPRHEYGTEIDLSPPHTEIESIGLELWHK